MRLPQRRLTRPSLGGLLATRQGSMAVALACAICAAVLIFFSLSRYKTQVKAPPAQATVLVATGEIAQGTTGKTIAAERLYRSTPVAASQVTPGAISDAGQLANETAQTTILPGQQLTSSEFTAASGVAGQLTPTQRAVAVSISESPGVTDVLQAGDHVDVYADFSFKHLTQSTAALVLIVPDALVIKPASAVPIHSGGVVVTGSSLVLAVTSAQAAEIAYAADNAGLYLTLRPTNAAPSAIGPITQGSILKAALAQATALSPTPPTTTTPSTSTTTPTTPTTPTTTNGAHH